MERFEKQVAIKAVNDDEKVATGVVLTPWEVDRQGDWLRPDGVEAMFNPSPQNGVMHAAFPDDAAELVRNEILDEPETIDGERFSEGEWVIRRKYQDDELWSLVGNILHGFSIGGRVTEAVEWSDPDELPAEVTFPTGVEEGATTEIVNGTVDEVSDVDIPAVPAAAYATVKSLGKSVLDEVSTEDEFVELMEERGHKAQDAADLWSYIEENKRAGITGIERREDAEKDTMTDEPEHDGRELDDEDIGFLKRLRNIVKGSSDPDTDVLQLADVSFTRVSKAVSVAKAGRTLSEANQRALMAAHDAIESALQTEVDFRTNRFTDDPTVEFDVADFDKSADVGSFDEIAKNLTDAQVVHVSTAIQEFVDSQGEADMSVLREWLWNKEDELDPDVLTAIEVAMDEFWEAQHPSNQQVNGAFADWVEQQAEAITIESMSDDNNELSEKMDELTDTVESIDERVKSLESEDEEEEAEKAEEGEEEVDVVGALKSLEEKMGEIEDRVDEMSKASADTQQAEGTEDTEPETSEKEKFLNGLTGGAN